MRKLFIILLLALSACSKGQVILGVTTPGSAIVTGVDFTKTIPFEGNSFTFGHNVDPAQRYSTLFMAAKGGTEDNDGVNGQGIQTTGSGCGSFVTFNPTSIPTYNDATHGGIIFALGLNDIMRNDGTYNPATFKTHYTTAIQYAINTRGWPANKIIILTPFRIWNYNIPTLCGGVNSDGTRIGLYNIAVQEVANENGCHFFDIYSAMSGFLITDYQGDQIHVNASGHAKIANILIANLNDLKLFVLIIALPSLIIKRGKILPMATKKKGKVITISTKKAA